jgi:hypothetical protein
MSFQELSAQGPQGLAPSVVGKSSCAKRLPTACMCNHWRLQCEHVAQADPSLLYTLVQVRKCPFAYAVWCFLCWRGASSHVRKCSCVWYVVCRAKCLPSSLLQNDAYVMEAAQYVVAERMKRTLSTCPTCLQSQSCLFKKLASAFTVRHGRPLTCVLLS